MKKIITLIISCLPMIVLAQDSSRALSNYEKFINTSGTMTKIVGVDVEKGNKFISVYTATDIQSGTSFKSVKLGNVTIDMEELNDFIKALVYIKDQVNGEKPINQTGFFYSTKNGVTIAAVYALADFLSKPGWNISIYQVYKYLRTPVNGTTTNYGLKALPNIIDNLNTAKGM